MIRLDSTLVILFLSQFTLIAPVAYAKSAKPPSIQKRRPLVARPLIADRSLSPERKMVVNYFTCFERAVEASDASKCALKFISNELPSIDRRKMGSWLSVYPHQLHEFVKCDQKKLREAAYFPLATALTVCAQLEVASSPKVASSQKHAIFYFDGVGPKHRRLKSVFY